MSLEADALAVQSEPVSAERRTRRERRGKDRRKPTGRINRQAPRQSLMKVLGAHATGWSSGLLAVLLLASEVLDLGIPLPATAFFVALAMFSCLVLMLGGLEQRLIEIRLELMMANGGMRQGDRRDGERRGAANAGDGFSGDRRS